MSSIVFAVDSDKPIREMVSMAKILQKVMMNEKVEQEGR